MAAAQARGLAERLHRWLWLLPVRVDDRRLWMSAALGVLLRWSALQGQWWTLREAMTGAVAHTLQALGMSVQLLDGTTLALGEQAIRTTVSCTHVEVFALLAPLLWNRKLHGAKNLARLTIILAAVVVLGVVRIDLSIVLLAQGLPWVWAHDVLLGICYALAVGLTLHHGGWMRPGVRGSGVGRSARIGR